MRNERQPRWWRYSSYSLLAVSMLVTAAFFLSRWLVNAEIGGQHDLGMGIAMAFGSALGIYVSILVAAVSAAVAVPGMLFLGSSRTAWLAAAIALTPVAWLLVAG